MYGKMLTKTSREEFISPRVMTAVPMLLEHALLVASGPQVDSSFVIEGQEVQDYFEESDLSNAWD